MSWQWVVLILGVLFAIAAVLIGQQRVEVRKAEAEAKTTESRRTRR